MPELNPRAQFGDNYDAPRNVIRRALDRALRDMHVLRDKFATAVLGGVCADPQVVIRTETVDSLSEGAYALADAMLKAKFDSMTWDSKK